MTWKTRQRSDFGRLKAVISGAGPQVLLLHGVGLRAEAWGAQIEELSKEFRVIAPDMAGHGDSPMLTGAPTLSDFVAAVADAMSTPAVVVGHSMGATMALDLASRYPELVRGIGAFNAIYRRSDDAKAAVQARAASLDGVSLADPEPTLSRWFGRALSAERSACAEWLRNADPAGYRAAYRVFAAEDGPSDAALRALNCPALFMTGSDEPNSTPEMSAAMAKRSSNGWSVVLDGAAHMMPMTHPAAVNAALRDLIQRCEL